MSVGLCHESQLTVRHLVSRYQQINKYKQRVKRNIKLGRNRKENTMRTLDANSDTESVGDQLVHPKTGQMALSSGQGGKQIQVRKGNGRQPNTATLLEQNERLRKSLKEVYLIVFFFI